MSDVPDELIDKDGNIDARSLNSGNKLEKGNNLWKESPASRSAFTASECGELRQIALDGDVPIKDISAERGVPYGTLKHHVRGDCSHEVTPNVKYDHSAGCYVECADGGDE